MDVKTTPNGDAEKSTTKPLPPNGDVNRPDIQLEQADNYEDLTNVNVELDEDPVEIQDFELALAKKKRDGEEEEEEGSEDEEEDEEIDRGGWDSKADFVLACIGYAVGVGNIWRFPYLVYKNGGGAFLIPYTICLFIFGIPLFYMEIGLGQYLSTGGLSAWQVVPAFKGVGYASFTISLILNVYYIVIIAWTLVYFVASFFPTLPWTICDGWWNDIYCYDSKSMNQTNNRTEFLTGEYSNVTVSMEYAETPAEQYWNNFVLQRSDGIEEIGGIVWYLAVALVLAWLLTYVCIVRGVKTTGKIVWFTTSFPYVVLTILLIRAVTLPGASDGIYYYLIPDLDKLLEPQVWVDAGSQIFFTLGIGIASLISLGSYNKYNNNIAIDAFIVCIVNCLTSFYAGFMVFGTLGYMAWDQGKEVADVVQEGPGLTFIAVPTAIAEMPGAHFFAVCFFFMMLLLGLDSQFCVVEGFYTCLCDEYPHLFRKYRPQCLAVVCLIYYALGIPCVTRSGVYYFELMNVYGASGYVLLWVVFWECMAVCYGWGIKYYMKGLADMLGGTPSYVWPACWCVICPILLVAFSLSSFLTYGGAYYEDYKYPLFGEVLGWLMAAASMHWVITYFIYAVIVTPGTLKERWYTIMHPRPTLLLRGQDDDENMKGMGTSLEMDGPSGTFKSIEDGGEAGYELNTMESSSTSNNSLPPSYDNVTYQPE
ncbi:sodium- and chloride-dependent GABA transporter 1-like [Glandiceps talaboti]